MHSLSHTSTKIYNCYVFWLDCFFFLRNYYSRKDLFFNILCLGLLLCWLLNHIPHEMFLRSHSTFHLLGLIYIWWDYESCHNAFPSLQENVDISAFISLWIWWHYNDNIRKSKNFLKIYENFLKLINTFDKMMFSNYLWVV